MNGRRTHAEAIRRAGERGHADHSWLDSHHTFRFEGYYDPRSMGFRHLRVINQDRVAPGRGFGARSHLRGSASPASSCTARR